jgi:hypothetical protein
LRTSRASPIDFEKVSPTSFGWSKKKKKIGAIRIRIAVCGRRLTERYYALILELKVQANGNSA